MRVSLLARPLFPVLLAPAPPVHLVSHTFSVQSSFVALTHRQQPIESLCSNPLSIAFGGQQLQSNCLSYTSPSVSSSSSSSSSAASSTIAIAVAVVAGVLIIAAGTILYRRRNRSTFRDQGFVARSRASLPGFENPLYASPMEGGHSTSRGSRGHDDEFSEAREMDFVSKKPNPAIAGFENPMYSTGAAMVGVTRDANDGDSEYAEPTFGGDFRASDYAEPSFNESDYAEPTLAGGFGGDFTGLKEDGGDIAGDIGYVDVHGAGHSQV